MTVILQWIRVLKINVERRQIQALSKQQSTKIGILFILILFFHINSCLRTPDF